MPRCPGEIAAHLEGATANALRDADLDDPANDEWVVEWIAEARQDETVGFPVPKVAMR